MPKIDLEMQTLDYLVYQTNQLNHPVSNLILNKYLFIINLINYVETNKFLFEADFIGFGFGPTDTNIYDEYNRKNKDNVDQLVAHDHVYYDDDNILHIEQIMPNLTQTDPRIKQLVTKYLPNLLSYNFEQLFEKLNQAPYKKGYNKIYDAKIYHDLKNYYQDIKNRFWMFNAKHQPKKL